MRALKLGAAPVNGEVRLYVFSLGFVRKGAAGVAVVSTICASCDLSIELVLSVIRC